MKYALDVTFHLKLTVLLQHLVIHWSNICFLNLVNMQEFCICFRYAGNLSLNWLVHLPEKL